MASPKSLGSHTFECTCSTCEAAGAGYFAQRAALDGDKSAAERLAPAVYAALVSQRGNCSHNKRGAA